MGVYRLDYFRLAGICISIISILTILIGVASFVHIQSNIAEIEEEIVVRQAAFKAKSQVIWGELIETGRKTRVPRETVEDILKKGTLHQCSQCTRLLCPQGSIGHEGAPGNDGQPGLPGKPGAPGFDGTDVELEPQEELPCSICPAGPQGPRGAQGERGLNGPQGHSGPSGHAGRPGQAGGHGAPGARGAAGTPGANGLKGPSGDTIVAGEGIKGPPGLAGPQGPKGPPGTNGRSSNIRGPPGRAGGQGSIGATGKFGAFGEQGGIGAPGEPGLPATYCPSDCGVNTILSQIGINAQHPESINGESGAAPASYPEEVDIPEPFPTPASTVSQSSQAYKPSQEVEAAEESFEETSYRNFFSH